MTVMTQRRLLQGLSILIDIHLKAFTGLILMANQLKLSPVGIIVNLILPLD
ncbi:hypothetical protein REIS_1553 [Rickettsia endosymbiont of Ixodes scapularis]|nr:hypothetical protein REIS_1553 [Rickettsia endosymbiont of Ixodes scapularis]